MSTPAASNGARTEFAAVSKFRFGAAVHTEDGELGSLENVTVDPAGRTVTAMGVKFGLFGAKRLIPIQQVAEATQDDIHLRLTRAQVEQSKEAPAGGAIDRGTPGLLNGKRLGRLAQLTADRDTHALRHLVVDRGLGGEVVLSGRHIAGINQSGVAVDLPKKQPDQLTPYRRDDELHEEIRLAIEAVPRLRVDLPGMDIRVIDGVVWLRGHVASDLTRRLTQETIWHIRGIGELHNELISDTALAAAVSTALARDPATTGERGIGVYPRLGEVFLRGRVRSEAAIKEAMRVAGAVAGVKRLLTDLRVDPAVTGIPELAGVTNTEDLIPGGR
jgi:osmotically-inducible protein OsmY/uncharacterized protein YrrD